MYRYHGGGPMFPGTDNYVSILLIYQLFSLDFVFVYDCLCVVVLEIALTRILFLFMIVCVW